jgi:hypothetical protein
MLHEYLVRLKNCSRCVNNISPLLLVSPRLPEFEIALYFLGHSPALHLQHDDTATSTVQYSGMPPCRRPGTGGKTFSEHPLPPCLKT